MLSTTTCPNSDLKIWYYQIKNQKLYPRSKFSYLLLGTIHPFSWKDQDTSEADTKWDVWDLI
jgi:hypothetical protein